MLSTHPLASDVDALRTRLEGAVVLPARTPGTRPAGPGTWPSTSVARVEAGALWLDVTGPAYEAGLAPLAGSSPDVGVVGYTLGGGLSWLGRRYGLACNRLIVAELVTAEGQLVRASRHEHADLFWALRGGGGSFGAVVAIEFELLPVREVYAGTLLFPWERAREVMHAWREWTATVPDSVTTSADHAVPADARAPRLPARPRPRGRRRRDRRGRRARCGAAGPAAGARAGDGHFASIAPVGLSHIHMDPEEPVPAVSDSALLDGLTAETIDALVDATGPASGSPLLLVELRHLGGALGRYAGGALSRVDGEYLYFAVGIPIDPSVAAALEAHFAIAGAAVASQASGRHYLNFAERPTDPASFYGEETYARLRRVRARVDPLELFRGNHEIAAA